MPRRYDLAMAPDLEAKAFRGRVTIETEVVEATAEIVLNAADLTVGDVVVTQGGTELEVTGLTLDDELERLTIALSEAATAGPLSVTIDFDGTLDQPLRGFYLSTFTDPDGSDAAIATTQFEATHARRAFPCFDEPDFKATFSITLQVDPAFDAVSNAAEKHRTLTDGGLVIAFEDTMVQSTYLVAFVVGPIEASETVDAGGTPLRVVYPKGQGGRSDFALDVATFALAYFTDYFGCPYPGGKLDLVAVPDFAFGAMENTGCITFREVYLLVDPTQVPQPELQRICDIISHELAHMWFGNLVTMKWWNGLWLNEAFATFMEMKATDAYRPEWQRWVDFGVSRSAAFDTDGLAATRPIEFEVTSPDDAEAMFDILTYEKGAAVVRMLEQHLSESVFREGLRRYMADHAFANTETTDLWDTLETVSGEPCRSLMDTWIFQGGHPVIEAATKADGTCTIHQEHFRYLADADDEPPADGVWSVPVAVRATETRDSPADRLLLTDRTPVAIDQGAAPLINADSIGFYRVRYTPELLAAHAATAQAKLHPIERYSLVDDAWADTVATNTTIDSYLALVVAMRDETDLSVWQRLIGSLGTLGRFVGPDDEAPWRDLVEGILASIDDRLGPDPSGSDDDRSRQLRGAVLAARATQAHAADAIARSRALLAAALAPDATKTGDPSLTAAATLGVAHHGTADDYDRILAASTEAAEPQDRLRYLNALADFRGQAEVARFLELPLTSMRSQDAPYALRRSLTNDAASDATWAFLTERWDEVCDLMPSNSIARMLEGVVARSRPAQADAVRRFIAENPVAQAQKTIEQHLERLAVQTRLRASAEATLGTAIAAAKADLAQPTG